MFMCMRILCFISTFMQLYTHRCHTFDSRVYVCFWLYLHLGLDVHVYMYICSCSALSFLEVSVYYYCGML